MINYVKKTTTSKVYRESTLRKGVRLIKEEKGRDSLDGNYEKKTTKFSLLLLKVPEVVRPVAVLILRA